jgi:type II secretory pathway component PulJ
MMRLRTGREVPDSDAGFTIAELAISIVILGVIGAMLSQWFVTGIRTTMASTGRNDDVFATRNALEVMKRDIQLAVPKPHLAEGVIAGVFVSGTNDSISMYANIDGRTEPSLVTWAITNPGNFNGTLRRTVVRPTSDASTGAVTWDTSASSTTRTVKDWVKGVNDTNNGNTPPIFRYLDATNAARSVMCVDVKPTPTAAVCTSTYSSPLTVPLTSSSPIVTTDGVYKAVAVEVYLQVASAGDGKLAAGSPPFYETSKKTGTPLLAKTRIYPLVNTVNTTTTP